MIDGAVVCGAPISRQSFSCLESHIFREHHAVGLSKYTEVTKQARGQNRRRARWCSAEVTTLKRSIISLLPHAAFSISQPYSGLR